MPSAASCSIQSANVLGHATSANVPLHAGGAYAAAVLRLEQEHRHLRSRDGGTRAVVATAAARRDPGAHDRLDEVVQGVESGHVEEVHEEGCGQVANGGIPRVVTETSCSVPGGATWELQWMVRESTSYVENMIPAMTTDGNA
jgi:hypothetical protein